MKYLFLLAFLLYPFFSYSGIGGSIIQAITKSIRPVKKSVRPLKKNIDEYSNIKPKDELIKPEDELIKPKEDKIITKIKDHAVETTKEGAGNIDKMLNMDDDDQNQRKSRIKKPEVINYESI